MQRECQTIWYKNQNRHILDEVHQEYLGSWFWTKFPNKGVGTKLHLILKLDLNTDMISYWLLMTVVWCAESQAAQVTWLCSLGSVYHLSCAKALASLWIYLFSTSSSLISFSEKVPWFRNATPQFSVPTGTLQPRHCSLIPLFFFCVGMERGTGATKR